MSKARDRVLDTAERLFQDRGYNSLSMRDLADALGMKQASLYYHVPGGKEELFVEVTRRGFERHRCGILQAAEQASADLEAQLLSIAEWALSQPPMFLMKMMEGDMLELSQENQALLNQAAFSCIFLPLSNVFSNAIERSEARNIDPFQLAGIFLTILEGVAFSQRSDRLNKSAMDTMRDVIDVMLNGLRPRTQFGFSTEVDNLLMAGERS